MKSEPELMAEFDACIARIEKLVGSKIPPVTVLNYLNGELDAKTQKEVLLQLADRPLRELALMIKAGFDKYLLPEIEKKASDSRDSKTKPKTNTQRLQ